MKTRDAEALDYMVSSGHWRVSEGGEITTRRDKQGRVTDPEVWRPCTFLSQGNRSSARRRVWVNGRRVYAARVVWRFFYGPIPDGYQIDHKDDNSTNDHKDNLELMLGGPNLAKEAERPGTRVKRFQSVEDRTLPPGAWDAINTVATAGDVPKYEPTPTIVFAAEEPSIDRSLWKRPDFYMAVHPAEGATPDDWRLNIAADIKARLTAIRGRLRAKWAEAREDMRKWWDGVSI